MSPQTCVQPDHEKDHAGQFVIVPATRAHTFRHRFNSASQKMSLILLVDDHEPICQTLKKLLQLMGHEAVIALNGRQALAVQKETPADVLLTDIFMPEMDGYELIRKFRQDFPAVKVIAMSGGLSRAPDGPFLEIAEKIGAQWLLRKPFSPEQLSDVIDKATAPSAPS
jgi:CheY-like chemotaxis protein